MKSKQTQATGQTVINRMKSIYFLMPISAEEFNRDKVIDGSSKIVLDFLRSHRDQASTQDEIIKEVNPNYTPEIFIHFLAAMAPLQHHGLVERREISDELYYRAT